MTWRETIRSLDWIIIACALLLLLIGLAMFFSATYNQATISPFFIRQGLTGLVGLIVCVMLARFPYHSIRRYAFILYALLVGLELFASLTGRIIRGTVSRLEIFGMQLQPSEFVKIVLIIALAWLLSKSSRINLNNFFRSLIILGIPAGLVIAEPDLGMAIVMITIWAGLLVFWGLSWRVIIALGLIGALLFGAGWHWVFLPYQKQRITSFLNPTQDPLGAGYNVNQAIVALGSGQLLGRGLGHGPQSQLKFLPERQTDFILASIGEELGFVGIALIIILYAVMLTRIIRIAHHTNDPFGQLICAGACIVLAMSLAVSAGMNMGLLPVTGIPLSFVSYGGSNLLSSFILLGIVQSVRTHSRFAQTAPIEISHII